MRLHEAEAGGPAAGGCGGESALLKGTYPGDGKHSSVPLPPSEETLDLPNVRRYLTFVRTTVSTKGQIILPAEIRRRDHIKPGQEFEVERIERGIYRLTLASRPRNEGLVKLLLACPVKGWFKPAKRSETTNDVKIPKLG